jgi:hypothetical protein
MTSLRPSRRRVSVLVAVACVFLCLVWRAEGSVPGSQTVTPGFPQDEVFRIGVENAGNMMPGAGTATLIGEMRIKNTDTLRMSFVTADHVLGAAVPNNVNLLGFQGVNMLMTSFNITTATGSLVSTATARGGPTGKVDIGFVGATVNLAKLPGGANGADAKALLGLTPITVGVAPNKPPFNFTEIGYGVSGSPDATYGGYPYVFHSISKPGEAYGIEHTFNNTIQSYLSPFVSPEMNGVGPYSYDGMTYTLRNAGMGAIPMEGAGLAGDSGSPLLINIDTAKKTAEMVGVFTASNSVIPLGDGNFGIYYGLTDFAVRMTADYQMWLNNDNKLFLNTGNVPEPSTLCMFLIAGFSLVFVRWLQSSGRIESRQPYGAGN